MMKTITHYVSMALLATPFLAWGQSSRQLDVNNIRATVHANNSLFWDLSGFPRYEVPKGSSKHTLNASSLWFIGENGGNTYGFADRYLTRGSDVTTGPLKTDGSAAAPEVVNAFDRIWRIRRDEIDLLRQAQASGELAAGTYVPSADIREWPGNGPAGYSKDLAPFFDANGDGIYNIMQGDYPVIKGEQMLFWVLNDGSGVHNETGLPGMGVEIHVSFYACSAPNSGDEAMLNNTTFLEYKIVNRSTRSYDNVYAGFNSDADIGYAMDDYVGSFVDADAFYFYNGDAFDGQTGQSAPDHYGNNPPVQSIVFLEGEVTAGRTMSGFMKYDNSASATGDPQSGTEYYNLLKRYFRNGVSMNFGGDGFPGATGVTTVRAQYMYPGTSDPMHIGTNSVDPGFIWTQANPCPGCPTNSPADQRGVGSGGPFTLAPLSTFRLTLGLLTTFDSSQTTIVEKNHVQSKLLKQWFSAGQLPCAVPYLNVEETAAVLPLTLFPNPADARVSVRGESLRTGNAYRVSDLNGKVLLQGSVRQDGLLEIDTERLSPGLYFIRTETGKGTPQVLKFVKE